MTFELFRQVEDEIVELVSNLLDTVKNVSFSDYVLLLSRASYQVENENTYLSPYVIQSNLEIRQDKTRERFLSTYLNQYVELLQENVFLSDVISEFNINLQLMMYSHVWESHRFLMNMLRITNILTEGRYLWRIQFEKMQLKNQSRKIQIPKGKIIEEQIIQPLSKINKGISDFISSMYDNDIRNAFAHSSYMIDYERGCIELLSSESYTSARKIYFHQWESIFVNSVLFSYHLTKAIIDRLNNFKEDYPNVEEVLIQWPSFRESGKYYTTGISPILIEIDGKEIVKLNFIQNLK